MPIKWSNNYDKFDVNRLNRKPNLRKVKGLIESMAIFGFREANCIDVQCNGNNKFLVIDGHHRIIAAKELGLKIAYVVSSDSFNVFWKNWTQKQWTVEEFLSAHMQNNTHNNYETLKRYVDRYRLPITNSIFLLNTEIGRINPAKQKNEVLLDFKKGDLTITDDLYVADTVGKIADKMKRCGVKHAKRTPCIEAIVKSLTVDDFDMGYFLGKVEKYADMLNPAVNSIGYVMMFEKVYNWRRPVEKKIPLTLMVKEKQKEREVQAMERKRKHMKKYNRRIKKTSPHNRLKQSNLGASF